MGVRRRPSKHVTVPHLKRAGAPPRPSSPKASDALPIHVHITNAVFFTIFFTVVYYLLARWREKIRTSIPLHLVSPAEVAAIVAFVASFIYLAGFFDFLQSLILRPTIDTWSDEEGEEVSAILQEDSRKLPCAQALDCPPVPMSSVLPLPEKPKIMEIPVETTALGEEDEEIICSVVVGTTPSYSLESKVGDCRRAAAIRREALQRTTGKSLKGLPLEGFDYSSILGQCCEMPVGYVQIPVGIAGPLLLDGREFWIPMATTEGCLVASTNRGCKAIFMSGGATSVLLRDGMTRAPVVRFESAKRASELKMFLESPENFVGLAAVFNRLALHICIVFSFFFGAVHSLCS